MKKLLALILIVVPLAGCSASIGPQPVSTSTTYSSTPGHGSTTVTKSTY